MRRVLKKLQSNNGATLMLALLFFVVCAVTGSMILVSATASAGRLANMKRRDQNYFAVRSAVKMIETQMEVLNSQENSFTDILIVEEVESEEEEDSDLTYTYTYTKDFHGELNDDYTNDQNKTLEWIKNESISNFNTKDDAKGTTTNNPEEFGHLMDVFEENWFNGMIDGDKAKTYTIKEEDIPKITFPAELEALNVETKIEINSHGVITYYVYNPQTIDGKDNQDIYYMTIIIDVEVPSERSVSVSIDEDEDTTTTTTTYENKHIFKFNVREIKKGFTNNIEDTTESESVPESSDEEDG